MEDMVRVGSLARTYARISMVHYADAEKRAETINGKTDFDEISLLKDSFSDNCVVVVVFSAMALEAYFNDYIADRIGDKIYYENFDMLRTTGKMQLIAEFILKEKLDKGDRLFQLVDRLFRLRNSYIHNKSENGRKYGKKELPKEEDRKEPDFDGWVAGLKTEVEQELASAREAFMALCETLKWIETKDRYSHALFSVLGADAYSYLEKEIKEKISRVQKEFGIPQIKND